MPLALQIIIYAVALGLVGFIISFIVIDRIMFVRFCKRMPNDAMEKGAILESYYDDYREEIKSYAAKMEELPCERVSITSVDGLKLSARYYNTGSKKLVLFCHGFHSVAWNCFGVIGSDLREKGYDFLVIDQRSHWESEGEYITYGTFESEDILSWLSWSKKLPVEEIALYGISMGAASIGFAADRIEDKRVKKIVLDCGFTSFGSLVGYLLCQRHVPFALLWGTYYFSKKIAKINTADSTEKHLSKTDIPVLFLHGDKDIIVSVEDTKKNYSACASEKKLIIVEGAGHATSALVGGEKVRKEIIDFIQG